MTKNKILVVDDDSYVRRLTRSTLEYENMEVHEATNGSTALAMVEKGGYDLVLLDIMLGNENGLDILRRIHEVNPTIPVILVSGKNEEYDKILGLGVGADDYITKPFSPMELCARVKAHIRRNSRLLNISKAGADLVVGPFIFDTATFRVFKDNEEIFLSSKEMKLMKFFLEHPNQVFSKEQLYDNVWQDALVDANAIMVYISHLRKKIEKDPHSPEHLVTVWGIGYKFIA